MDKNNLLLSFPRSGNSWVRYVLEYISKRPTSMGTLKDCQEGANKTDIIGAEGVDKNKKCIVIKRHKPNNSWDNWTKDNTNLIFLLRDWREACLRHLTMEQRKNSKEIKNCVQGYVDCLRFFDTFDGNKILIYYEDLIRSPKENFDKIINFLNINKNNDYIDFWKNFKNHKQNSIRSYQPGSSTLGIVSQLKFHSKRAPISIIKTIDSIVKNDMDLFNKYLRHYD